MSDLLEELEVLLCEEPQWVHSGASEDGEIHRTAKELGIPHEKIRAAIEKGKVAPLKPHHLDSLQNTDANQLRGKKHAKKLSRGYGRNIHRIFKGFRKGATMPAPVVLHRKGHAPYLIGGNTRLMAATVAGITPHAVHAHLD